MGTFGSQRASFEKPIFMCLGSRRAARPFVSLPYERGNILSFFGSCSTCGEVVGIVYGQRVWQAKWHQGASE